MYYVTYIQFFCELKVETQQLIVAAAESSTISLQTKLY